MKSLTEIGVFSMGDTSTEISSFSYSDGRFFICRGGSFVANCMSVPELRRRIESELIVYSEVLGRL